MAFKALQDLASLPLRHHIMLPMPSFACCSLNKPTCFPTQGLCTCCALCLKHYSPSFMQPSYLSNCSLNVTYSREVFSDLTIKINSLCSSLRSHIMNFPFQHLSISSEFLKPIQIVCCVTFWNVCFPYQNITPMIRACLFCPFFSLQNRVLKTSEITEWIYKRK